MKDDEACANRTSKFVPAFREPKKDEYLADVATARAEASLVDCMHVSIP